MKKILVLGSSIHALSVALEAKKKGYAVELADSHTELCPEITMAGHSFLRLGKSLQEIYAPVGGLKKIFMQKLLDADIRPLLMSTPVGLAKKDGKIVGAVLGNKFGLSILYADHIIDTTGNALSLPQREYPESVVTSYTFVCEKAMTLYERELPLPEDLGIADHKVYVHPQVLPDTMTFEIRLRFAVTGEIGERTKWELEAREKAVRVFAYLKTLRRLENITLYSTAAELCIPSPAQSVSPYANVTRYAPALSLSPSDNVLEEGRTLAAALLDTLSIQEDTDTVPDTLEIAGQQITDFSIGTPKKELRGMTPVFVNWKACSLPAFETDALIAGAGTSGMPATIALLENGVQTAVVEPFFQLGGTRTVGRVSGHYHGNRAGCSERINGEVAALSEKYTGNGALADMNARMLLYADYLRKDNCTAYLGATVCGAWKEGDTLCGVAVCSEEGLFLIKTKVTVDTTSDADVAALSGVAYDYGSPRDGMMMTNGQWGVMNWSIKHFTDDPWKRDFDVIRGDDYADLLRGYYTAHGRNSDIDFSPFHTLRETRRIHGRYTLTLSDVLLARSFPDTVALGLTPYDTHGRASSVLITLGMLLFNAHDLLARIPYRCFLPEKVEGLLVGGKAISATRDAGSLCRMNADVENAGYALGLAAGMAVHDHCPVSRIDVSLLQQKLTEAGCLTEPYPAQNIDGPTALLHLYAQNSNALLELILQKKEDVLPALTQANTAAFIGDRTALSMAQCWFGLESGADKVLELMKTTEDLADWSTLESKVGYGMKPITFEGELSGYHFLNRCIGLLGVAANKKALPALLEKTWQAHAGGEPVKGENPYHKNRLDSRLVPGFERIAVLCFAIERMADRTAAPALAHLLSDPHISGYVQHDPYVSVNFPSCAWLEMTVARTLARCGGADGYARLIDYISDTREVFARHAENELSALTGQHFGRDEQKWRTWLTSQVVLPVIPYTELVIE